MGLKETVGDIMRGMFVFTAPTAVEIKEPGLGIIFRISQIGVLLYVCLSLYFGDTWAFSEQPMGFVNAWAGGGSWTTEGNLDNYSSMAYCSGAASFSYMWSPPDWDYTNPRCVRMHPYEVTVKEKGRVSVTTGYIEIREVGWPATSHTNATQTSQCAARNGVVSTVGQQRICMSQRMLFPTGVEQMTMSFEHSFMPATTDALTSHLIGGSNAKPGEPGAVTTRLIGHDGERIATLESGSAIGKSVGDWLAMAGIALNDQNTNLTADYYDQRNTNLTPDQYRYPTFRTAGVAVDVYIAYDNRDHTTGRPMFDSREVFADVTLSASTGVWAGSGPKVEYASYPTDDEVSGAQTYDKFYHYRQGVVFQFRSSGIFYIIEWMYVLNMLIQGLVLMAAAKTITNFIAMFLHPKASMIRNACIKEYSFSGRFAEIGMKAALAAQQFERLDEDFDNHLDLTDLVATYARIGGVTFEQAYAIAHLVMHTASQESAQMKKARAQLRGEMPQGNLLERVTNRVSERVTTKGGSKGATETCTSERDSSGRDVREIGDVLNGPGGTSEHGPVDFGKFLLSREGSNMIPWSQFLLLAPNEAKALISHASDEVFQACKRAFDEAQANFAVRMEARKSELTKLHKRASEESVAA